MYILAVEDGDSSLHVKLTLGVARTDLKADFWDQLRAITDIAETTYRAAYPAKKADDWRHIKINLTFNKHLGNNETTKGVLLGELLDAVKSMCLDCEKLTA